MPPLHGRAEESSVERLQEATGVWIHTLILRLIDLISQLQSRLQGGGGLCGGGGEALQGRALYDAGAGGCEHGGEEGQGEGACGVDS